MTTGSLDTIDTAYDVLGLEALFLVPRIFALLSLNRYFGTLIPCLKEMTKDFVKFLSLVVILYLGKVTYPMRSTTPTDSTGFLTTFVLLARGVFSPKQMVSSTATKSALYADLSVLELDFDQGLFWVRMYPIYAHTTLMLVQI